jgi:hypothetical protein
MQIVLVPNATEGLLSAAGWRKGCKSAPRAINYRSWDEEDDSNACNPVTGYPGPVLDVSSVQKDKRFQVTVRLPADMATAADGNAHLGNVCKQNLLPLQQVCCMRTTQCRSDMTGIGTSASGAVPLAQCRQCEYRC